MWGAYASLCAPRESGSSARYHYIYIILLVFLFSCQQKAPRPEQAWPELAKLGQALHDLREQAGRFALAKGSTTSAALALRSYPDKPLSEQTVNKMLSRLSWLKPALISPKNQRYARLLRAHLQYEQQRLQDATRHYQPLGKWPQSFRDPALKQRRYRRQLAAQGVLIHDPKTLYHQALRALGDLERRGDLMAGAGSFQSTAALQTRAKPLADWQKDLRSKAQGQGLKLLAELQNCQQNQCIITRKRLALRAAVDLGIQVLALPRARVVKMFHTHSRLGDDEISVEIERLRRQPGQAMAAWMGLRAYEQAIKNWLSLHPSSSRADAFWNSLGAQGPMDVEAIKELAQAAPADPRANADQKPSPVPAGSDLH